MVQVTSPFPLQEDVLSSGRGQCYDFLHFRMETFVLKCKEELERRGWEVGFEGKEGVVRLRWHREGGRS